MGEKVGEGIGRYSNRAGKVKRAREGQSGRGCPRHPPQPPCHAPIPFSFIAARVLKAVLLSAPPSTGAKAGSVQNYVFVR